MALHPRQKAFLAAYAKCGNITTAAENSGIGRQSHYDWFPDEEYKTAFDVAHEESIQRLEKELERRATVGEPEILYYQGQPVMEPLRGPDGDVLRDRKTGRIRFSNTPRVIYKKSDTLLIFYLKSLRPERYRDNSKVEVGGPGGGPLKIEVTFVFPNQPQVEQ